MNNGYEFYREIRKIDTKVKVCFLTASEIYNETLRVPPPRVSKKRVSKKSKELDLLLSTIIYYYYLLLSSCRTRIRMRLYQNNDNMTVESKEWTIHT